MYETVPTIHLELNLGTFKIKTNEAVYFIEVNTHNALSQVTENQTEKASVPKTITALPPDVEKLDQGLDYQEISEEMFGKVGKLARELSLSIREIPSEVVENTDFEETEIKLEAAKGQLEAIVEMTEKATMDIMDLTESILSDCQDAHNHLGAIMNLNFMSKASRDADSENEEDASPSSGDNPVVEFLDHLLKKQKRLRSLLSDPSAVLNESEAVQEPKSGAEADCEEYSGRYRFDLNVILQAMYELCTNEKVKSHIKAMSSDCETLFDAAAAEHAFSEFAPDFKAEDNFFELPLASVLKALHKTAQSDKHRQILKKISQTMDSIFLDGTLPVEGHLEERETTTQPEPIQASSAEANITGGTVKSGLPFEKLQEILTECDENIRIIEEGKAGFLNDRNSKSGNTLPTILNRDDREVIITSVESAYQTLQGIITHITRILEALSFQDLSGQRIMKIVHLINHVQIQLLGLLVAFGTKLRKKDEKFISSDTVKLVQAEVDKIMERGSTSQEDPGTPGRLDQNAVNNLLEEMGF
ncbi:MAG: protein phosphatase CheZ [Deltaproteobacteria bacterium]|nr:protein phosphatase CheZ [Deltaproteobacteria bacterium]MBW2051686.1 protein phosphatase CheZ [Deltaproteobacteria bacterium]MBW2140208.1 protein phosphatase CheZ [Deltaproteobacteria bacterium]MBW2323904.1 protein phosphatase CheZ [Deltaproteobacteria bacterium]